MSIEFMFDAPAKQEFVGKCEPISDAPQMDSNELARRKLLTFILAFAAARDTFANTQLHDAMAIVVDKTFAMLTNEFGNPVGADYVSIQELANRMREIARRNK